MKTFAEITAYSHLKKKKLLDELAICIAQIELESEAEVNSHQNRDVVLLLLKTALTGLKTIECDDKKIQIVTELSDLIEAREQLLKLSDREQLIRLMNEISLLKGVMENLNWDCLTETERLAKYNAMISMGRKWKHL